MGETNETRPKLLLADDSVTIRKVVELTFADEGIDVSAVSNAEAAMAKFVEIQPDIVLVDVGLDGTNGYHICEMIKQDEATRHIPVLLLVGSFEPFDQDEAERVEADGFLTKPFHSIRDLVARVWDLLGRNSASELSVAEIAPESEPPVITPEIADIENLYQSSFAETAEIEEFDTVDDLLGDSGMDDDMIEASYPANAKENESAELSLDSEEPEQTKAFDWSPESIVTESVPTLADRPVFEPRFVFDESDAEDEETVDHAETVESFSLGDVAEIAPPTGGWEISETTAEKDVTIPQEDRSGLYERLVTPEFIELVAQRVVEKLSDNVVREIAKDAVPRIAEKLIREALEEDKKA